MLTQPNPGKISFLAAVLALSSRCLSAGVIFIFANFSLFLALLLGRSFSSLKWDNFATVSHSSIHVTICWNSPPERDLKVHHLKMCITAWEPEHLSKMTGKLLMYVCCCCPCCSLCWSLERCWESKCCWQWEAREKKGCICQEEM